MFKKIKQRLAIEEEVKQLRREIRLLRQEHGINSRNADELFQKLTETKAANKIHEKRKAEMVEEMHKLRRDAIAAREMLKRQEVENARLRDMMEPLSCDGCIYQGYYRKCVSCARYPKLKDKYVEDVEETTDE